MIDRLIRIFLAVCIFVLAISIKTRRHRPPAVEVSDNGIVPPELIRTIIADDLVLDRPVGEWKFDIMPLEDAIGLLRTKSHTAIDVNWKALEGAGIDRNAPAHGHLHDATLRQALNSVANVGGATTRLTFAVHGNAVEFSTAEDLIKEETTEIYNIRPLIERIQANTSPGPGKSGITREEATELIARVLTDTVAPDSWKDAGGTAGTIREMNGLLMITEPQEAHREIATLLTRLDVELRK